MSEGIQRNIGTKREEKLKLELLADSIPGGVAKLRYEMGGLFIDYANKGLYNLMHVEHLVDQGGLLNVRYDKLLKRSDWEVLKQQIEINRVSGEMIRLEYQVEHEGRLHEWRLMQAMILEENHLPILQSIITDITDIKNAERQMDSLVENIPGGIFRVYYDGDSPSVEYVSDMVLEMLGYTREDYEDLCRGKQQGFRIFKEHENKLLEEVMNARRGQPIESQAYKLTRKDGTCIWIDLRAAIVSQRDSLMLVQYVMMDVTEAHTIFEQMRKEKEKLSIIADISADVIFEYDMNQDIMFYTKANKKGLDEEPVFDDYIRKIQAQGLIHEEDQEALKTLCEQMKNGHSVVHVQLRKKYKDNQYHWIEIDGRSTYDALGKPDRVIGKICNIDERKENEKKLQFKTEHDSLTGLLNYSAAVGKMEQCLARLKNEEHCCLLILDVDNFRQINEKNGHVFGDAVLRTLSDELSKNFMNAIHGRIGGDEFFSMVHNLTETKLQVVLEGINKRFSELNDEEDDTTGIKISVGGVICTKAQNEFDKAFRIADHALYLVKTEQKGSFCILPMEDENLAHEVGYLCSKENKKEHISDYSGVQTDEDIVLFTLELLDNVTNIRIGLKMISERIIRHFHFDEIFYINNEGENYDLVYHWGRFVHSPFERVHLDGAKDGWKYVNEIMDDQGITILTRSQMEQIPGEKVGSLMLVKNEINEEKSNIIIFVDKWNEHSWEHEKNVLLRLANIIFKRIEKLQKDEQYRLQIEQKVNYDAITGLPNYTKFLAQSDQYLQTRNDAQKDYYFSYADFSNFQYLNDVYGYSVGDTILKKLADKLKKSNPFGIYHTRITSDHFVSFLECPQKYHLKEDLQKFFEEFCLEANKEYSLCNLILIAGLAKVEGESEYVSAWVDNANVARKYGKNTAETSCILYDNKIRESNESEMAIVAMMASALENNEFEVYLQPKIGLDEEEVVGAEALVRWRRKDGSYIYPDQFIPVMEKNGFITKVDFVVLEKVMHFLRETERSGEQLLPISVNFSRLHNEDEQFVTKIAQLLNQYQVDAKYLEAEITESVYMYDLTQLNQNIKLLKDLGVKISIDDFGSGYSSLTVLSKITADIIKLDKQFLNDCEDERSIKFTKYLIRMMKHLGFRVIAEGVETKEQVEMLKTVNCDMVQGYYYARPMPIEAYKQFLKDYKKSKEK